MVQWSPEAATYPKWGETAVESPKGTRTPEVASSAEISIPVVAGEPGLMWAAASAALCSGTGNPEVANSRSPVVDSAANLVKLILAEAASRKVADPAVYLVTRESPVGAA